MTLELSTYLDLLRIVAALAVFFGHAAPRTGGGDLLTAFHLDAVTIFFVLSGFVIAFVTRERERSASRYATARMARLYSVAVPAILVTLVFDQIGHSVDGFWYDGRSWYNPDTSIGDILRYLTFTNELWNTHIIVGTNEPYWSLGFEVCYYVIFGCVVFMPIRREGRVIVAIALLVLVGPKIAIYFPLWLMGAGCFHATRFFQASEKYGKNLWLGWTGLFVATPLILWWWNQDYGWHQRFMAYDITFDRAEAYAIVYNYVIAALTALNILAFSVISGGFASIVALGGKYIRWLAGATFSLYLMHQPVLLCFASILPGEKGSVARTLLVDGVTLATIAGLAELSERRKDLWRRWIAHLFARSSSS